MNPQPTASDRELAEKIIAVLHARHPWRPSVDLIARHRSEHDAGLREERDKSMRFVNAVVELSNYEGHAEMGPHLLSANIRALVAAWKKMENNHENDR